MLLCVRREVWPRRILILQIRRSMISKTAGAVLIHTPTVVCAVPAFDFLNNILRILFIKILESQCHVCETLFDSDS